MLSSSRLCMNHLRTVSSSFLQGNVDILSQQTRNTFILKRRHPLPLMKKGQKTMRFKSKHFVYDLIEDTNVRKANPLNVILLTDVENIGDAGQLVSVKPNFAYEKLLLPGLAVYASPDNIKKYKTVTQVTSNDSETPSTMMLKKTINTLSTLCLSVVMSMENPWVLEKWHIRTSFRKAGIWVPEDAITMPDRVISGPDLSKERKQFYVTVTVHNTEEVKVRCCIHHWTNDASKAIPFVEEFWKKPTEPIFEEDKPILDAMPVHIAMQEAKK